MPRFVSGEQVIERSVFSFDDDHVSDGSLRLRRSRFLSLDSRSEYHLRERQKSEACPRAANCARSKAKAGERHASKDPLSVLFLRVAECSERKVSKSEKRVTTSRQSLMAKILRPIMQGR